MSDAQGTVLVLNAGSSSLKFRTYALAGGQLVETLRGQIEGIGAAPRFVASDAGGAPLEGRALAAAPARGPTQCSTEVTQLIACGTDN